MSREIIEISEENKKYFLERRNAKFEKKEFYKIIINETHYDGSVTEITEISIPVPGIYQTRVTNFWGREKYVQKEGTVNEDIGVYAMKDETGIREMVTGKAVTMFGVGNANSLYCYGLIPLGDNLIKIGKDLKFLDNNLKLRKKYIDELLYLSNRIYEGCEYYHRIKEAIDQEEKQEAHDALQYLKSYKVPRN